MKRKSKLLKICVFTAIPLLMVALLGLLYYWYDSKLAGFEPEESTYQIWCGTRFDYASDASFYDTDGNVTIKEGDTELTPVDAPILYSKQYKLTTVTDMLMMQPETGMSLKRILALTTVSYAGGRTTFTKGDGTAQCFGGFMYDGKDMYIFLEKTTLTFGNVTVELGPLSYVTAVYNDRVEYFNSEDQSSKVYGLSNVNVTAVTESGYVLDLGRDCMERDGNEYLLFSAVSSVKEIEMER